MIIFGNVLQADDTTGRTQVIGLILSDGTIRPTSNSTTALTLCNAAGTAIVTIDTTNSRLVMADAANIQVGTTTGTKIGLTTSAKLGFYGVTPVVQPTALTAANAGTLNSGDATTDTIIGNMRTRINELETKLKALGLLA